MEPVKINSDKKTFKKGIDAMVDRLNERNRKLRNDPHHTKLKEIANFLDVDYDPTKADSKFTMTDIKEREKRIDNKIKETDKKIVEALFYFNKHSRKAAREVCLKNQEYLKKQGIWEGLLAKFKKHFEDETDSSRKRTI